MATETQMRDAVVGFASFAIQLGKDELRKREAELGRRLTATEADELASMVVRQAQLAVAIKRAGG